MRHPSDDRTAADAGVAGTLWSLAILAALVLLVWLLSNIVLLIFLAALIAIMLRGVADWAARNTGAPQMAMLAAVAVAVTAIVLGLVYFIGPRLIGQTQALWTQLNQAFDRLRETYGGTEWGKAIFQHFSPPQEVQQHLVSTAGTVATTAAGAVATAFILIVTALYFAIAPDLYIGGIVRLFPRPYRPRAAAVMSDITVTLRRWSLGQLIDMCVVGVLTGIGLFLLGVPLALALAVLAGLFTFVPYFGAIAAAVPAVLVGFTVSWQTSLWVVLIFLVCHGIEGYLIAPIVQRNTADLPPALTILSMTVLGTLFGALGVILGTPVAAAVLVVVREVYVRDVLGDQELSEAEVR